MQAAMNAVLGCGSPQEAESAQKAERLASVQKSLLSVWTSLPKDGAGRVDWKLFRYMAHRYFMQRFGVLVRGLEPTLSVNASTAGEVEVLKKQAPELADQIFGGGRATNHGFSLEDATAMVAALEHLLFDSERSLLEKVYHNRGYLPQQPLTQQELNTVMVDFMLYWMFGEDESFAKDVSKNEDLAEQNIPHWQAVKFMIEGSVRATEYAKYTAIRSGDASALFSGSRGFE